MDTIKKIIDKFDSITIGEMDSVELFNRVDTKYIFNKEKLPEILKRLSDNYRVLDIKGVRLNKYETLYFDTDKYDLYQNHHNGITNRFKVRFRRYTDTNKTFLEVKQKNNKEKTIKQRIKQEDIIHSINEEAKDFLINKIKINPDELKSKLWVYYTRIILVNKTKNERVTIDMLLNFSDINTNIVYPKLVIAEIKQEKAFKSDIVIVMKDLHLRPGSISKYCLGVALLNENIKQNNFKNKIKSINKINHE